MNIETIDNVAMLITAILGLLGALFRYLEIPKRGWLYITIFFLANLLSDYYWTMYTLVMGENPDVSALVAYFGWNIGYVVLLLTVLHMRPEGAGKFFNPLILLPIPLNIYQFTLYLPFGGIINNVWQGLVLTAIACTCLQVILFYLKNKKKGVHFPYFHTIVLLYVMMTYGMWTVSCFEWPSDIQNPYYYCAFLNYLMMVLFAWSAGKDYEAEGLDHPEKTSSDMRFQILIQAIATFIILTGCLGGYYIASWMKSTIPAGSEDMGVNSIIVVTLFMISVFLIVLILAVITLITIRYRPGDKEKVRSAAVRRTRFNFIFTLIITLGLMIFVIAYTSRLFYRVSVTGINENGEDKAEATATELENYLTVARSTLWVTADSIDIMVKNGDSLDEIIRYLTEQTLNQKEQFDENFTGLYGYVYGEYIDGTDWVPPEGYEPTERDWYKAAVEGKGKTVIAAPYVDAQTHSTVITICKLLSDNTNVVALDVIVNHIQEVAEELDVGEKGYGIIVDRNGSIVAHPVKELNGTSFAEKYSPELLDLIIETGEGTIKGVVNDEDSTLFVSRVMDQWYVVIVVSDAELFEELHSQLRVSITVFLIIYLLISFFYYLGYKNEQAYGRRMEEMSIETQRQEYEARMLKLEKASADEANKAKSSFLADMSHEIRTPINAILGMNEMILREERDAGILEYSRNIKVSGRNLLQLINSILDFSKIEDGKMEIVPVSYRLSDLVTYLVNSISERARAKELELIIDVDPGMPSGLYGDDSRIDQIIMNLLTNAVKYTREGSVTLTVREEERVEDKIRLYVEVKDTGIGIKEEDMGRLFESFERLDVVKNRNIEGTGLGMSITTKLLKLMDSELKVESIYGEGSRFYFELWQRIEDDSPIGDYRMRSKEDAGVYREAFHAPEARILIVDDTELNIKVAVNLLKETGLKIDTALNGEKAVRLAGQNKYDVILMDQRMPGMDGTEALNAIRALPDKKNLDTPVICLTADAIRGAREKYMKEGFTDYLTKRVEGDALESMLLRYLPQDKLIAGEDSGTAAGGSQEKAAEGSLFAALRTMGVNTDQGLGYCGNDKELYTEVLSDFAGEAPEKIAAITGYYENGDWKNYSVYIHSLKSTSRMIGANNLSDAAADLERASKEEDVTAVESGHSGVMEMYEKLTISIKTALQ